MTGTFARPSLHRPAVPVRPGGVFTRPDAMAADWTDAALACAVDSGRLRRMRRGVYTSDPAPTAETPDALRDDLRQRGLAAAAGSSHTVLSHAVSALTYGLPVACPLERPCLTMQRGTGMRGLADVHLHRALLAPGDVRVLGAGDGAPKVTAPARTVLDIANMALRP